MSKKKKRKKFLSWSIVFGEDVEQLELSYIAGGSAKLYRYSEKQFGSFLQSYTYT